MAPEEVLLLRARACQWARSLRDGISEAVRLGKGARRKGPIEGIWRSESSRFSCDGGGGAVGFCGGDTVRGRPVHTVWVVVVFWGWCWWVVGCRLVGALGIGREGVYVEAGLWRLKLGGELTKVVVNLCGEVGLWFFGF